MMANVPSRFLWLLVTMQLLLPFQTWAQKAGFEFFTRVNVLNFALFLFVPGWWAPWCARGLYGSLFFLAVFFMRRYEQNRQRLKLNLERKKLEAEKQKELDQFKSRLYTDLIHEFRTPLTVILGTASQIGADPEKNLDQGVRIIEGNGRNMLRSVNQLLVLSKVEDTGTGDPGTEEASGIEDAFIQKVQNIIEEHYADENFSLPLLCQKIGMSRSQLFRKMQALIQTAPSDFIRSYRLKKAKSILETTDLTVSEVAWKVGYKDPAHFSKSFQEEFGYPPSSTRK